MGLEPETRKRTYDQIKKISWNPLKRTPTMAIPGSVQPGVSPSYLEKRNLIKTSNDRDYVRYFARDRSLNETKRKILSLLRRSSCRYILIQFLNNLTLTTKNSLWLSVFSPSTISRNINKPVKAGIIERTKTGRISTFTIVDPSAVYELLIRYKENFLDTLVDGFIEMWEFMSPK